MQRKPLLISLNGGLKILEKFRFLPVYCIQPIYLQDTDLQNRDTDFRSVQEDR